LQDNIVGGGGGICIIYDNVCTAIGKFDCNSCADPTVARISAFWSLASIMVANTG
jgi:hypothetical protein